MNDEQLGPVVSAWLKEENRPPSDPTASVQTAMNAATKTRQLRRWWWLPPFVHRMPDPPSRLHAVDHTSQYEPSPIPASNGHAPTAIGRTTSMLSPVKAITAGAIVAATAAAFLLAQPFSEQVQPPAAVEPAAPVAVSGTGAPGPCLEASVEKGDVVQTTRDNYCNPIWRMSDERLSGTVTWSTNEDKYLDDSELLVRALGVSVVNDEGSWRMQPEVQFGHRAIPMPEGLPSEFVLVGSGAYDGLHALLAWDGTTYELSGFILSGGLPPEPAVPPIP